MIPPLPGWTWEPRHGGVCLRLIEHVTAGHIDYTERKRPLARVSDLVGASVSPPERLVTAEGEYAAFVLVEGKLDGRPVLRPSGFVFGDDFYSHIDGLCVRPELFARFTATVRELIENDAHLLGIRRRRFYYRPPPAWRGVAPTLFHAYWLPPDHPRNASQIMVAPAFPFDAGEPDALERLAALQAGAATGFQIEERNGPLSPPPHVALSGSAWELRGRYPGGPPLLRDVIVLADRRYAYTVMLDSPDPAARARNRPELEALLRSIEPIPSPGIRVAAEPSAALAHWV